MPVSHLSSVNEEISHGAVQLLREYTGRGPTKVRTEVNSRMITIVRDDPLTKGERNLAGLGEKETVLKTRHANQQAMREALIALVEKSSGCKVAAMLSDNHIGPDIGVEFFVLKPQTFSEENNRSSWEKQTERAG
jgi:uncharacterized protein YbcI